MAEQQHRSEERRELSPRELLDEFGLVTEADLAALLGITVPSLRNRPRAELPAFTTAGRRRLYYKDSVRAYLDRRRDPHCFESEAREMAS